MKKLRKFQGDSEQPNVTEELTARIRAETLKAATDAHVRMLVASTCSTDRPHCESEEQEPGGLCHALWRSTCLAHRCFPTQRCPGRDEARRLLDETSVRPSVENDGCSFQVSARSPLRGQVLVHRHYVLQQVRRCLNSLGQTEAASQARDAAESL